MTRAVACCAFLLALTLLALPATAGAQPLAAPGSSPWQAIAGKLPPARTGARVQTRPRAYAAFTLDRAGLAADLAAAPRERRRAARRAPATVVIPAPDGTLERFTAVASPVVAPALARRFPQIRTYAGRGIDDPTATARFDLTPLGFRASVRSEQGAWLVDPYYRDDRSVYVAYYRQDADRSRPPLFEPPADAKLLNRRGRRAAVKRDPGDPVVKRTYRLALANDPSYSAYFGTTDLMVESAKASLMNRVNQLYNDDLAIRMELVGNDYLLNFKTDADYAAAGYGDQSCDGDLLDSNQAAIDSIIGAPNYDIGHIVKRAGGGGIARLESVGQDGEKAMGCTGVDPPIGDGFAIDYVAHEMGHQFGGPHTFDGVNGSCMPPNRDFVGTAAVEPGSGTSIQAYAGICADDDLQPNSDPYFSQSSITDIIGYVSSDIDGATEEGTETTVANRSPVVTAPQDRTIPVQTPFSLPGSANDPDGDGLVYLWEQNDPGMPLAGTPLRTNARPFGPLFRVFGTAALEDKLQSPAPGQNIAREIDKVRTFPDPAQIAADNTNAETGLCGGSGQAAVDCFSEQLPTAAYATTTGALHFRLTVRDRDITGGGVSSDDVTLTLSSNPAPFAVTGPTPSSPLAGNEKAPVSWNTAGTGAGTPAVRITYSTDGGLTFPYVALASTANDGSQMVIVPNVPTTQGRFKVEAIENYFFDVSDGDLTVTQGDGATPTPGPSPTPEPSPAPTVAPLTVPQASPTPTAAASATPGASASASATATATATATPAVTPFATAAPGFLRPDLRATPKRPQVSRKRKLRVLVRCRASGSPAAGSRCRGSVRLFAKLGKGRPRRIAHRSYTAVRGATRVVTLTIRRRAFRRLSRRGTLKTVVRASANGRKTRKRVTLRR